MPVDILDISVILLFFVSFWGLITSKSIVKTIIFITLMQTAVVVFWLRMGAQHGTSPPIIYSTYDLDTIADPLPQALMLTAIIIGVSVTAVAITMLNNLLRKYNISDWNGLGQLAIQEMETEAEAEIEEED